MEYCNWDRPFYNFTQINPKLSSISKSAKSKLAKMSKIRIHIWENHPWNLANRFPVPVFLVLHIAGIQFATFAKNSFTSYFEEFFWSFRISYFIEHFSIAISVHGLSDDFRTWLQSLCRDCNFKVTVFYAVFCLKIEKGLIDPNFRVLVYLDSAIKE